jgi:hypothetical protein
MAECVFTPCNSSIFYPSYVYAPRVGRHLSPFNIDLQLFNYKTTRVPRSGSTYNCSFTRLHGYLSII